MPLITVPIYGSSPEWHGGVFRFHSRQENVASPISATFQLYSFSGLGSLTCKTGAIAFDAGDRDVEGRGRVWLPVAQLDQEA